MADDVPHTMPGLDSEVIRDLYTRFGEGSFVAQATRDGMPTLWVGAERIVEVLRYLKGGITKPYRMLYDLTAVDERLRKNRQGLPPSDFTIVYQLLSVERDMTRAGTPDLRLKVALKGEFPHVPTATAVYANANWYEREVWDLFGIVFDGHPNLRRSMLPPRWVGHPLRKEQPARATEFDPFVLDQMRQDLDQVALLFKPEE